MANSLAAVAEGVGHVQGTINGYGERCGNANLVSIIPNLMLKMGLECIPRDEPARAARRLALRLRAGQPQAVVVAALRRRLRVRPQGRHPRVRRAEASGDVRAHRSGRWSAIIAACSSPSWPGSRTSSGRRGSTGSTSTRTPRTRAASSRCSSALEDEGFQFEGAEASFELLMERALGNHRPYFELDGYRVIVEERQRRRGAGGRGHRAAARQGHRASTPRRRATGR